MEQRCLGKSGIKVSAIGLGCMSMSEFYGPTHETEAIETLQAAYELGINFFDTADMYGKGENEKLLAKVLKPIRDQVIIGTKCGLVRDNESSREINSSKNYIKKCCEASLKRLGIEYIDVYYLHRKNPNTAIEESMEAMAELHQEGKILSVGLCEVHPDIIRRADKIFPVSVLQSEYSILFRQPAETVLATCKELNIAFVPFSPLGRGFLSGDIQSIQQLDASDWRQHLPFMQDENIKHNLQLVKIIAEVAEAKQKTPAQIALAWLLAQDPQIIPIPGTTKRRHLEENCAAIDIELNQNELSLLDEAHNKISVKGERYPIELISMFLKL